MMIVSSRPRTLSFRVLSATLPSDDIVDEWQSNGLLTVAIVEEDQLTVEIVEESPLTSLSPSQNLRTLVSSKGLAGNAYHR